MTAEGLEEASRADRIASLGFDYAAREKEVVHPCNLCGADQWTILTHRDRYGFPAEATACAQCGLTVLNPRLTASGYKHFYETVYRPLVSAYHGRRIDAHTVKEEQRVYAAEMERLLAPYLREKQGWRFLDIGGSTGVVAAHFARRFGLAAVVLDPAPEEIAEAKSLGIQTVSAMVEEWSPGNERFQAVAMFQTIDHLLDVSATLKKIRALITEDGIFTVDIVDFRAAYLKHWSVEAAVKIDHPFSLTEEVTEALLARAGFQTLRKAYSSDYHLVAYVCRPCAADPTALPPPGYARQLLNEVRYVQNAPRPVATAQ